MTKMQKNQNMNEKGHAILRCCKFHMQHASCFPCTVNTTNRTRDMYLISNTITISAILYVLRLCKFLGNNKALFILYKILETQSPKYSKLHNQ